MYRRYDDYHMPIQKQTDSDRRILLFVASKFITPYTPQASETIERNQQSAKMSYELSNKSADEMQETENVIHQLIKMII